MSTIGKSVGDATPARAYNPVVLVDPDTGEPVGGGGGGGGGGAPLTNDDFVAVMGEPTDAAWNGSDASATVVAVLKALYPILSLISMAVNEIDQDMDTVKGLLNDIKTNTSAT